MNNPFKRLILGIMGALAINASATDSTGSGNGYSSELDGRWRGALVFPQGASLTLGINIEQGEMTLDSPNQGMFGRKPTQFSLDGNSVSFTEKELNASFEGVLEDGRLKGRFLQGKHVDIELQKLDAADRERLVFEGSYRGDLIINKTGTLPLQLNVAVLADGYLGTLDSPAQHSYAIPLTELSISDQTVSFQSPMIQASYTGRFRGGAYRGTFVQGMERELDLKKVSADEEGQASVPKPQAGDHGGALAVITPQGVDKQFYAGHDAATLYEIGSNTKTMVAYLLARALAAGKVSASTSLSDIWPAAPADITLVELASHRSGLPRLPPNMRLDETTYADPYAHYDGALLHKALAELVPGEKGYLYSNFGFGVLGEALAENSGLSFSELLNEQLLKPFAMADTYVATGAGDAAKLAQGYDVMGEPVSAWHFDALAGAGAVVSSLDDMIKYLQSLMAQDVDTKKLIGIMLEPAKHLGECCTHPLGWMLDSDEQGRPYAWHAGQTAGFTSVIGFYLDGSRAMVWLNNQSIEAGPSLLAPLLQTSR